jgi:hypothetical protein
MFERRTSISDPNERRPSSTSERLATLLSLVAFMRAEAGDESESDYIDHFKLNCDQIRIRLPSRIYHVTSPHFHVFPAENHRHAPTIFVEVGRTSIINLRITEVMASI